MNAFTKKHIETIRNIARNNTVGNHFAAAIIYENQIYYGNNKVNHCFDPTHHAEIDVIRLVCSLTEKTLLKGAKILSSGEPCPLCLTAIAWAGIKEVYYLDSYKIANKNGFAYDRDCKKVNRQLNLGLKIKQLK